MALFPCDVDHHAYRGPQQTIYPAIVSGGNSVRRKLRLCPDHFLGYLDQLEAHAHDAASSAEPGDDLVCVLCDKDDHPLSWGFYATVYASRNERRDFWGSVHERCATALAEDWQLDLDMP